MGTPHQLFARYGRRRGDWVAVECDERRWSEALAKKRGGAVARFRTTDHLGARVLDHPARFATHASALREIGSRAER